MRITKQNLQKCFTIPESTAERILDVLDRDLDPADVLDMINDLVNGAGAVDESYGVMYIESAGLFDYTILYLPQSERFILCSVGEWYKDYFKPVFKSEKYIDIFA